VGQYRLGKCSAAVVMLKDASLLVCCVQPLQNCSQYQTQVCSADCGTGPLVSLVTCSAASQFTLELVLEHVEQRRKNGVVALRSLPVPGSLTYCCLEYISGNI